MPFGDFLGALGISAVCAGHALERHAGRGPRLDLRDYLAGPLTAAGMLFDYAGRASLSFTADMEGRWDGDGGTLTERFSYSDGRADARTWSIRFDGPNGFTATAHDVVGTAAGEQRGNAARMRYRLRVPRGNGQIVLSMDDWFYLQEDGTLIGRTRMRKFRLPVGELVVVFRKAPA